VSCPDGVDAKAGTTFTCTATLDNGQKVTIPLVVASTNDNGGTLNSNAHIVDQALAVDLLYQAAQSPLKSVDCPTDVPASVGKTFDCKALFASGKTSVVTLKVVSVDQNGNQNLKVVGGHST
jgi:acyl CoA:acetate/3-ketoacid CoA transferase beta subunit